MKFIVEDPWRPFGHAICVVLSLFASAVSAQSAPPSTGVLAEKMKPFVDENVLPGAVMLVGSKDKTLDLEAVGYSDLAAKKPMATDDFFWIASMSKAMTASALMMLVEEGKVNLDDPVEKYLPEFKGQMVVTKADPTPQPASHPITVREILSHSSGLPFGATPDLFPLDRQPLAAYVAGYGKAPLQSQPGTAYSYSNAGLNTAGRIIEVVSGMPYEKFMQDRLFTPLGMKDTTFWPDAGQLRRLAKSYHQMPNPPHLDEVKITQLSYPLDKKEGRYPMPAGGLFSTATDVAQFLQMFLNNGTYKGKRILSPKSIKLMTTKETAPAIQKSYGFGWNAPNDGSYSHGGAYQTYMGVDPKAGIYRVFMVQIQGPSPGAEAKKILPAFIKATEAFGKGPASSSVTTEGQSTPH